VQVGKHLGWSRVSRRRASRATILRGRHPWVKSYTTALGLALKKADTTALSFGGVAITTISASGPSSCFGSSKVGIHSLHLPWAM